MVVSRNSEVFKVVLSGPFERLLELFDKGLASPFSVTGGGSTLLHVSNSLLRNTAAEQLAS